MPMHSLLAIALRAVSGSYPQCYPHQLWVIFDARGCGGTRMRLPVPKPWLAYIWRNSSKNTFKRIFHPVFSNALR